MKSIQETMSYLLTHHAGTAPLKPNVPMYLGNMQRWLTPADLADLEHVLQVIAAETMFLNGERADATPGYHADLLHMHLEMARALVAWENNEWEAHAVNPVIRVAALLVRRTQAWINYGK